ncbi:hypothetical protein MNBD_NITROSPINAE02-1697 [hydrothermal vent metagenome]|uniref:Uncharacterized protein n=1 Tax=hydrothermal vent metagenome TaxID=652676 RepID=A0A3B1C2R4_9ZZZZ
MRHAVTILVAVFIFSLAACGGGGGGSSNVSDSSGSGGSGGGSESSLVGTWKSVCMFIGGPEPYIIITKTYNTNDSFVDTVLWFTDSACASATGLKRVNQNSYSLGGKVTASGKSAYEIDITTNSWTLTQDGATAGGGTNLPTTYDLVAIEGKTLYVSNTPTPITNPADRPTTLDLPNYYTRQ